MSIGKNIARLAAASLIATAFAGSAIAQTQPSKPVGAPGVQGTNGNNGTVGGAQPGVDRKAMAGKPANAASAPMAPASAAGKR